MQLKLDVNGRLPIFGLGLDAIAMIVRYASHTLWMQFAIKSVDNKRIISIQCENARNIVKVG